MVKNGIYTEKDIRTQNKVDGERLGAKQIGSQRAGEKYGKALELFIRRRSSQTNGRTDSKDIEREERLKGGYDDFSRRRKFKKM